MVMVGGDGCFYADGHHRAEGHGGESGPCKLCLKRQTET